MNRHFLVLALAMTVCLMTAPSAHAKGDVPVNITGELSGGQGTSSLIGKVDSIFFHNKAPFATKIFKVCQYGDICQIAGKKNENDVLIELNSVKLIKKAAF